MNNQPASDRLTELLTQLQSAQDETAREWIVLQLTLERLAPDLREAVWAAAIPHWFDAPFLAHLLDRDQDRVAEHYEQLQKLSIVEPYPERGHNLHERARTLLLNHLWENDRERYRELSYRAVAYCETQDQEDTLWRVESIYHLLIATPEKGKDQLHNTGKEWHNSPNFAYDKVELMASIAQEHVEADRVSLASANYINFWRAVLDMDHNRYREAKRTLMNIAVDAEADPYLFAYSQFYLGHVHLMLAEVGAARARYAEALPIYRDIGYRLGEANALSSLGDVHLRLAEVGAARARYAEALPIYRDIGSRLGEANALLRLGDVHLRLAEVGEARERYAEALPIYRGIGDRLGEANALKSLGDVARREEDFELAQSLYEKALSTYQTIEMPFNIALAWWGLGQTAQARQDLDTARDYYQQALELFTAIGSPHAEQVQADLNTLSES
ncbi:MAG: tetratricopeptide repeat protein [Anaerolineales bacterium]